MRAVRACPRPASRREKVRVPVELGRAETVENKSAKGSVRKAAHTAPIMLRSYRLSGRVAAVMA